MEASDTSTPTQTDLELALAFYAVPVVVARRHETVTYGELVEQAKAAYPDNETVQTQSQSVLADASNLCAASLASGSSPTYRL